MLPILLQQSEYGSSGQRVGPVEALRIDGSLLRIVPAQLELARLEGSDWRTGSSRFAALVIESPVLLSVQRSRRERGPFFGPFEFVRIAGGRIYTSTGDRRTLADFDPIDDQWQLWHDRSRWRTIVFLPCGR